VRGENGASVDAKSLTARQQNIKEVGVDIITTPNLIRKSSSLNNGALESNGPNPHRWSRRLWGCRFLSFHEQQRL
jgi:hypothetical protein